MIDYGQNTERKRARLKAWSRAQYYCRTDAKIRISYDVTKGLLRKRYSVTSSPQCWRHYYFWVLQQGIVNVIEIFTKLVFSV